MKKAMFCVLVALWCASCAKAPAPTLAVGSSSGVQAGRLAFSGQRAHLLQKEFVKRFPRRHSGQPNNRKAALWFQAQMQKHGWQCKLDDWSIVNYSKETRLNNAVCRREGRGKREILVVAHHDQSPATIEGADNDASGIAILLHLGELFGRRPLVHTLVFVSTDAEEYGMLGTRRYVQKHPDVTKVAAGISLDNLGKSFYDGLVMAPLGQFRGIGALWLQRLAQEAARGAKKQHKELWIPQLAPWPMQMLAQAVPISFMDQGPMVAAGIPAFGFAGRVPAKAIQKHWDTYHSPRDTMAHQSPQVLQQAGRVTEALLRQLQQKKQFSRPDGPYLYFAQRQSVLQGWPLWLLFVGCCLLFLAGVPALREVSRESWVAMTSHFLGFWLPLFVAFLSLRLFPLLGLMDRYHLYPATAKDPAIFHPKWSAVLAFLTILFALFGAGRSLARRWSPTTALPQTAFGMTIVGCCALLLLLRNPFSLLFLLPTLAWWGIHRRDGAARAWDVLLFLAGGLFVYALVYFFGFAILRNDFAIFWYLMMMFSTGMLGLVTVFVATATLAAGLSLLTRA